MVTGIVRLENHEGVPAERLGPYSADAQKGPTHRIV